MHARRSLTFGLLIALLTALGLAPGVQAAKDKGDFIVVLRDSVARPGAVATRHQSKHGAIVEHVYRHTIKGYAAKLNKKELAELRQDPKVARVVKDGRASIAKKAGKPGSSTGGVASWGLDRIDEHFRPLNGQYQPAADGSGVTAYVIDTGVRISHREFEGRASYGWDFVSDDAVASDCHGHGTHVAGTIAGKTYGVAKAVDVVAIRVLDCAGYGSWSDIIAALEWVASPARGSGPKVANLSIGGPAYGPVDDAVAGATSAGVVVVVAAGNENRSACNGSPARAPAAITVGATTSSDSRASYSNYGTCVDLFAPGSSIKSAWKNRDTATNTISGTSMAAPHVAGVVAHRLGNGQPQPDPTGAATDGVLSNVGAGSPNRLLFTPPKAGQSRD